MIQPSRVIDQDLAKAILDLVDEMSTEIDLYYENDNLAAAAPAFMKLDKIVGMLTEAGYSIPETYAHIVERYKKSRQ